MSRYFYRIETLCDSEDDDPGRTHRGAGGPADVGMAVAAALGQMDTDQELDIHVERLSEQEE